MISLRLLLKSRDAERLRHRLALGYDIQPAPWFQGRVLWIPYFPEVIEATRRLLLPRYRGRLDRLIA